MITNKKSFVLSLAVACAGMMSCAQAAQQAPVNHLQTAKAKLQNQQPNQQIQLTAEEAAALVAEATALAAQQPTTLGKWIDKICFKSTKFLVVGAGTGFVKYLNHIKNHPGDIILSGLITLTFLQPIGHMILGNHRNIDQLVVLTYGGSTLVLTPVASLLKLAGSALWRGIKILYTKLTADAPPVADVH